MKYITILAIIIWMLLYCDHIKDFEARGYKQRYKIGNTTNAIARDSTPYSVYTLRGKNHFFKVENPTKELVIELIDNLGDNISTLTIEECDGLTWHKIYNIDELNGYHLAKFSRRYNSYLRLNIVKAMKRPHLTIKVYLGESPKN